MFTCNQNGYVRIFVLVRHQNGDQWSSRASKEGQIAGNAHKIMLNICMLSKVTTVICKQI